MNDLQRRLENKASTACAHCGNLLAGEDYLPNSFSDLCCSVACVALSSFGAGESNSSHEDCSACGSRISRLQMVASPDGLPFCSPACYARYPRLASSPEVARLLRAAAVVLLIVTAAVLAVLIQRFRHA